MTDFFSYACCDYPGMDPCPGQFYAGTESELWQLIELHAMVAHGEDPAEWGPEDRVFLKGLIKTGKSEI